MADPEPNPTESTPTEMPLAEAPRRPSTIALAVLITISLLALLGLGWLWFTRYAPVHFDTATEPTIIDAGRAAFVPPVLWLGGFLIALIWLLTWIRARWTISLLPIAIGIAGVLALVMAGRGFLAAFDGGQPVRVVAYICDPEADRPGTTPGDLPEGCEPASEPERVTIGAVDDPAMYEPSDDSAAESIFPDIPEGTYDAHLTTTAGEDIASVVLAAETDDGYQAVSRLERQEDATWQGTIAMHPNLDTYLVLMYPSPYEEAPDASIRFTVEECSGITLATFDPDACEPISVSDAPIEEVTPPSQAPGRPPVIAVQNGAILVTELEDRAYMFAPVLDGDVIASGRSDMLVMPTDGPQESDANILQPGEGGPLGTFTVEVTEDTEQLDYTIYTFADGSGVTTASVAGDRHLALNVRP